jgi:mannose-6-phosphate isomerase-like protein (cupin superfamily)
MANSNSPIDFTASKVKPPYEDWLEREGLPVYRGFHMDDLRSLSVEPWPRLGARGAYMVLEGTDEQEGAYILEISPGKTTRPERHLFEEVVYVLQGQGAASVWIERGKKQTFEWHAGSLFSPPLNAWHQLFNGSGSEPARLVGITGAPVMINHLRDPDCVFHNSHIFRDRYAGEEDYFSGKRRSVGKRLCETNLVPDLHAFELEEYRERGVGNKYMRFEMSNNSLLSHVSEFPVGAYKKAHRHGPAPHLIILSGKGYSLMWPEGTKPRKFDWREGSIIVPPAGWYHQHFNTGSTPARYLAVRWGSLKHPISAGRRARDVERSADQIEYEDQDPEIHRLFVSECGRDGITVSMAIG